MSSFSLTDREFGLLQLSIEVLQQEIAALGLNLFVENDFRKLVNTLKANGASVINPTIDPDRHEIGSENFWLNVVDPQGRTVATMAARLFEAANFTELVTSGKLFDKRGLKSFLGDVDVEVIETSRLIEGKINYAAGLWVHPAWRKKGLALLLPYLSRSLAIRNFNASHHCCYILRDLASTRLSIKVYGYAHQELSYKGYYPPVNGYEEMHLSYADLEESLDRLRNLPQHEVYPVSLVRDKDRSFADPFPIAV